MKNPGQFLPKINRQVLVQSQETARAQLDGPTAFEYRVDNIRSEVG